MAGREPVSDRGPANYRGTEPMVEKSSSPPPEQIAVLPCRRCFQKGSVVIQRDKRDAEVLRCRACGHWWSWQSAPGSPSWSACRNAAHHLVSDCCRSRAGSTLLSDAHPAVPCLWSADAEVRARRAYRRVHRGDLLPLSGCAHVWSVDKREPAKVRHRHLSRSESDRLHV